MGNMSYCRFQNTLRDLQDCARHAFDEGLSESEHKARKALIKVCAEITDELGVDDLEIDQSQVKAAIDNLPNGDADEDDDEDD